MYTQTYREIRYSYLNCYVYQTFKLYSCMIYFYSNIIYKLIIGYILIHIYIYIYIYIYITVITFS